MIRFQQISDRSLGAGLLLIAVLAASACASKSSKPGELPTPPVRLELNGPSFLPPNETGWTIAGRSPERMTLVKTGRVDGDLYLIEAGIVPLREISSADAFVRFVRTERERNMAAPRFRIKAHDITQQSIAGASCVVSYMLAEDRQPQTGENIIVAMLLESVAVACPLRGTPATAIVLDYSHRSFPEDQDRVFSARARPVVESLQFNRP